MKKSTLTTSQLYNPKRKPELRLYSALCALRYPVIIIGVIITIVYVTSGSRSLGSNNQKRLHSTNDRGVIVLNLNDVQAATCAKYSHLMNYTTKEYQEYFFQDPGKERYCLLTHMAQVFHKEVGDFVDIGTRVAASSLSLMSHGHSVTTIDIPTSIVLDNMVRRHFGLSVNEWKLKVEQAAGSNKLTIVKANLLSPSINSTHLWETIRNAPLIYLDTNHKPDSKPFEREFIQHLININYDGVVLLDDIYLNFEMQKLFDALVCTANAPYHAYDVTVAGHSSGTGLLDFEYNRRLQKGAGAYSLVVGASDEKLAEKAKKFSFLKGGGQLQRSRESSSPDIPIQFLPLKCENL